MKYSSEPKKGNASQEEAIPFIKWVGGKRTLLKSFASLFPKPLLEGHFDTYCEPFLGGGAVFLNLASRLSFKHIYLSDLNPNLVMAYQIVRDHAEKLIAELTQLSEHYFAMESPEQAAFFSEIRDAFNLQQNDDHHSLTEALKIEHTRNFIFLNKTCYGGMFRVNNKGHFNVPFGKHKRPQIVAPDNLRRASNVLSHAHITEAPYDALPQDLGDKCFIYFDPPYRPLSATSSFTRYYGKGFDDQDQADLAALFKRLDQKGVTLMLSNSDPKNEDPNDQFFEHLYEGYLFHRVSASRKINSNYAKRGRKSELVITNYQTDSGKRAIPCSSQFTLDL